MTPAFVHNEVENYEDLIVENSGLKPDRVKLFIALRLQYIEVVPVSEFSSAIEQADAAIGDTDLDDGSTSRVRSPARGYLEQRF